MVLQPDQFKDYVLWRHADDSDDDSLEPIGTSDDPRNMASAFVHAHRSRGGESRIDPDDIANDIKGGSVFEDQWHLVGHRNSPHFPRA